MEGMIQQALETNLLKAAQTMEDQIDAQLHQLDNLEEDDIERIRHRRIDEMKRMQAKKQEWLTKGHGELREITEKDFFAEMKGVDRMVCHFYRSSVPCQVMDSHLMEFAKQHIETKFVKIHAEKCPFLTERLKIWMLPTLAIIKNEKTTDYVVGFDELGGSENFPREVLEQRLVAAGAMFEDPVHKSAAAAATANAQRTLRKGGPERTHSDEDSDFD